MNAHDDDLVSLARDLIRIESHADAPRREADAAAQLANWFRDRGVTCEILPVEGSRANVVARVSGAPGPTLLLCGHLDTVPAGGMRRAFAPRVSGGQLHGRGACDMKGAVAAMACTLATLRESAAELRGSLVFAATVDEETGSLGVRSLVAAGPPADFAVVGEPTRLRLGIAHKGVVWLRLAVEGRSAHASVPERGDNAVVHAAHAIEALREYGATVLASRRHPLLGRSTLSVGRIAGGTAPNIVPDHCEVDFDRRTLPGEPDATADLRAALMSIYADDGPSAWSLSEVRQAIAHGPLETSRDAPIARAAGDALARAGLDPSPVGLTYWTDGAALSAAGVSTIVLGPGDIALAHGPRESVPVTELDVALRLYTDIARSLLRGGP